MPRAYAMTYVPRDATWKKMFKGQTYFVSCLALGCEQTKEASWRAANAWWYAKKAEVNPAMAKPLGSLERTVGMVNEFAGKIVQPELVPQVYNEMVEVALNSDAKTQSTFFFSLLGKERYEQLLDAQELSKHAANMVGKALAGEPVMQDTIGNHAKNWLDLLQVKVGNGKLSASSFDSYRREIAHFESFLGKFAPLSVINESALENYFVHLSKNDQKQAGKKLRFDVARMFVRKLYKDSKINLPRNLNSKDFQFTPDHGKKDTWPLEKFQAAYAASSGLKRLCLLLSANCCFHAADIAHLAGTIDWQKGTITKGRIKTEKRNKQKTTWFLWPETLELLKVHQDELPSLSSKTLVDGQFKRVLRPEAKGLKQVRTTTIDFLTNSEFKPWAAYYAGESDKTMIDKFYGSTWLETAKKLSDYVYSCYFPQQPK